MSYVYHEKLKSNSLKWCYNIRLFKIALKKYLFEFVNVQKRHLWLEWNLDFLQVVTYLSIEMSKNILSKNKFLQQFAFLKDKSIFVKYYF